MYVHTIKAIVAATCLACCFPVAAAAWEDERFTAKEDRTHQEYLPAKESVDPPEPHSSPVAVAPERTTGGKIHWRIHPWLGWLFTSYWKTLFPPICKILLPCAAILLIAMGFGEWVLSRQDRSIRHHLHRLVALVAIICFVMACFGYLHFIPFFVLGGIFASFLRRRSS